MRKWNQVPIEKYSISKSWTTEIIVEQKKTKADG